MVGPVVERLRLDIVALPQRARPCWADCRAAGRAGHRFGPWPESLGYAWGGERIAVDSLAVPERLLNVPMLLEVLAAGEYRVSADGHELLNGQVGKPAAGNGVEMLVGAIDAAPGTRFTLVRQDLQGVVDRIARELQVEASAGAARTVRIAWESADRRNAEALVNGVANSHILGQATLRRDDVASTLAFLRGIAPRQGRARPRRGGTDGLPVALRHLAADRGGTVLPQRQHGLPAPDRCTAAAARTLQRFTPPTQRSAYGGQPDPAAGQERRDMDARLKNVSLSEREAVGLTRMSRWPRNLYAAAQQGPAAVAAESDSTSAMRLVDSAVASMTPVGVGPWPLTAGGGLLGLGLGMIGVSARRRWKPAVADAGEVEDEFGVPIPARWCSAVSRSSSNARSKPRPAWPAWRCWAGPMRMRWHAWAMPGAGAHARRRRRGRALAGLEEDGSMSSPATSRGGSACMTASCWPAARRIRWRWRGCAMYAPPCTSLWRRPTRWWSTSPASGAGKTFAAVNLAVLFAEAGQRVLLIDADLRRGKVARWFDQPAETGLAEVLAGTRRSCTRCARPRRQPVAADRRRNTAQSLRAADAAAAGRLPARGQRLLHPAAGGHAPVMAVADATLVANLAGSTLLVVRADVTPPSRCRRP